MIDHEHSDDRPAPAHGACGVIGLDDILIVVPLRPAALAHTRELDGGHDVQDHRPQEHDAHTPEQRGISFEHGGICVHLAGTHEHLQVAHHVPNDKPAEDYTGDRPHHSLAG